MPSNHSASAVYVWIPSDFPRTCLTSSSWQNSYSQSLEHKSTGIPREDKPCNKCVVCLCANHEPWIVLLRYTVKLGENTLSLSGCYHICKKEIEEKKCCPGFWGTECYECPGGSENPCSGHGTCLDGLLRNGTCICKEQYSGFACQNCRDENRFGPDCQKYECTCKEGYQGDGRVCQPINPCVDNNGGCPETSTNCIYKGPGEASCVCKPGMIARLPSLECSSYLAFLLVSSCVCEEGEIGDGRSCYRDLISEINKHNSRGLFSRKLNVARKMFGKCLLNLFGELTAVGSVLAWPTGQKNVFESTEAFRRLEAWRSLSSSWHSSLCSDFAATLVIFLSLCIFSQKTIGEILASTEIFSRFETILENCGLPAILDGPGPFTVFVPSNDGVDKLRDGRLIYLFTEVRARNSLTHLELGMTVEKLIMTPHIVTMANQILSINISADGRIMMDDSEIPLNMRNIVASNGIIHTVDGIFIPPSIIPILPHRCNEEQHKIVTGSCVDCEALNSSVCPPGSREMELTPFPKECVYIHDPQGLNVLKRGCARYCNQTIVKPGCCEGFFGPDCMPCPGGYTNPCYGRGNCSDGIDGNGNCQCFEGFKGIACHICSNPNKHGENCDEDCGCVHGVCDNRPGSGGVCQSWSCKEGYTGKFCDKTSKNCGPSGLSQYCHQNAVCSLNDTARCICRDGYEGDGFSCQPIDLCSQPERGGCSLNALCTSTGPGNATCQCNVGWTGDGKACVAIDNCMQESRGNCHINADCIYIGPGQSKCVCKRGYAGDGHNCDAINPCLMDNGGCHDLAMCVPLGGGERSCACPEGYVGDGMTCYGDVFLRSARNGSPPFSLFFSLLPELTFPSTRQHSLFLQLENNYLFRNIYFSMGKIYIFLMARVWLQEHPSLLAIQGAVKVLLPRLGDVPPSPPGLQKQLDAVASFSTFKKLLEVSSSVVAVRQMSDNETVQFHVILGEKLLPADLRSGVHKSSMLGLSYWLMFYQNSTQKFVNNIPLDGKFFETRNGILIGVSQVLQIQKNRCTANTTTIQREFPGSKNLPHCTLRSGDTGCYFTCAKRSVCCPGYYGHMCEMCPGKPGQWCSGNGECLDGIEGSGECQCLEGFHGTACEMCEVGRYGADCKSECDCDNGICNDGLQGDGSCDCLPGWKGPGCREKLDPCTIDHGGCSIHAVCTKVSPGERTCVCKEGYFEEWKSRGLLQELLRYHMVGCQQLLLSDLEAQESLTSLSGHTIKITEKENSIYLNDEAKVIMSDIVGVNGVIHFINKILIPSDLVSRNISSQISQLNITEAAETFGYTIYSKLLKVSLLLPLVSNPLHRPFTMLWPTDAAFNALPEKRQQWLYHREHRGKLASYLKAHMIRGTKVNIVAGNMPHVSSIRTMHGSTVSFSCSRTHVGELLVGNDDAVIIQRHMEFNGGIAYGIDRLLEPPDLGSRCDEFVSVELQVSSWGDADEDPCCLLILCQQGEVLGACCSSSQSSLFFASHPTLGSLHYWGPLKRGCRRKCISTQWVPQCCANHYGRDCQACPGGLEAPCGNRGTCDDKISGSGRCNCSQAFIGTSCELCAPGRYGPECQECNCTEHGVCNGGLHGDGFCFCVEGWTGERCEVPLAVKPTCSPPCHPQASCRAGNLCECDMHYEGDGRTCTVIDMCSQDNGGCATHAACTQLGVNVSCTCAVGYWGDGYVCEPIDRCADGRNGDCSEHAHCISTGPNKRRCECKRGYIGDGIQCLEEAVPPTDRCLDSNGQCHREAVCTDLHFHDKTMGVFHLQSPRKKYDFTYVQAQEACAAEGAVLATFQQLAAAQQMGFHLCLVGWMDNGTAGYPTAFPTPSCGSNHVGIVDYGPRSNLSETWDAFCYREKDVTCACPDGFVGDGTWCRGRLPDVLAEEARFSTFYSLLLAFANGSAEGLEFFTYLSDDSAPKTLFVPVNSGFAENEVRGRGAGATPGGQRGSGRPVASPRVLGCFGHLSTERTWRCCSRSKEGQRDL
uniref:Stabilin 1 n=1 Tax=Chrysolophus pictus TaxID=9089 RepID=A0A8C3Q0S8_CHRPC